MDLQQCILVESAFPEEERCTAEKFGYRLEECSDICLGLGLADTDTNASRQSN
ncbi:hypothetical protein E8E11_001104 [Didymella keratinophila]|nr:hypothetical protein E8E11_001104 [Didymella keratinophila]